MRVRYVVGGIAMTALLGSAVPSSGLAAPILIPPARVTLFAGLQGGLVFRSIDEGRSWQENDTGLPSTEDIATLAVGAGDRGPIYAGTGGGGVFVSTDNGSSWHDDNGGNSGLQQSSVSGLATSPKQPGVVYAAAGSEVYRSIDGGANWSMGNPASGVVVTALALDLARPNVLVVGTQSNGFYLSTDSGVSWRPVAGFALSTLQVNQIAFDPLSAGVAYAATSGGIYQTLDGGQTWEAENRGIPEGTEMSAIAVDPQRGALVIAADSAGNFYGTSDGGATWRGMGGVGPSQGSALLYDPLRTNIIFAGSWSNSGDAAPLMMSLDGGADWQQVYDLSSQSDGILSLAAATRPALPTDPVNPPRGNPNGVRFFAPTGHTVSAPFLEFYNRYDGLKILGLPLTESYQEGGRLVQYFERAELVSDASGVREAPLGVILAGGRHFPTIRSFTSTASRRYFPTTKHSVSGRFLDFWQHHSGALLFGNPISEPVYEQNGDGTHRTYLVQYFQNARMEYHPELAGTANVVTLGQLGRQYLKQRGWL